MSELERRALLGAAGIGAVAAIAARASAGGGGGGGPLNPPAGTVASTGRTLDEVYNKIPSIGSADGRTPIPGGSSQFAITQPGSYVLTGNLSVTGNAITINTSGPVTLDLNGFRVATTSIGQTTINVLNCTQPVVRNGHISGGNVGLSISNCPGAVVEDLLVSGTRSRGIDLPGNSSVGSVVRRCTVLDTGITTTAADTVNIVAISVSALFGCRIEDCQVTRMTHNGTVPGFVMGIFCNNGSYVDNCVVSNSLSPASSVGISLGTSAVYRNNKVHNFATPYNSGVNGGGNF